MTSLFELIEGDGLRKWYIARAHPLEILGGPYRTRKEGRSAVFKIARDAGDPKPWPELEADPEFPGLAILRTGLEIYYVGRAAAFHDQGSELGEAIDKYLHETT